MNAAKIFVYFAQIVMDKPQRFEEKIKDAEDQSEIQLLNDIFETNSRSEVGSSSLSRTTMEKREVYRCDECGKICLTARGERPDSYGWCAKCANQTSNKEILLYKRDRDRERYDLAVMNFLVALDGFLRAGSVGC